MKRRDFIKKAAIAIAATPIAAKALGDFTAEDIAKPPAESGCVMGPEMTATEVLKRWEAFGRQCGKTLAQQQALGRILRQGQTSVPLHYITGSEVLECPAETAQSLSVRLRDLDLIGRMINV